MHAFILYIVNHYAHTMPGGGGGGGGQGHSPQNL